MNPTSNNVLHYIPRKAFKSLFIMTFIAVFSTFAHADPNDIKIHTNTFSFSLNDKVNKEITSNMTHENNTSAKTRAILGEDDREIIDNPSSDYRTRELMVGKLYIGHSVMEIGSCSGTLIGPNLVLTAAHCFHNDVANTVYAGITTFTLHYSSGVKDWRPIKAKKLLLPSGYFEEHNQGLAPGKINIKAIENDFAVIILEEDIGNDVGWHKVKYDTLEEEVALLLASYPMDMDGKLVYEECYADMSFYSSKRFLLDCDIIKGSSGAGLIKANDQTVWGVISGEAQDVNHAQRFSKDSFNTLANWYRGKYDGNDTFMYDMDTKENYEVKFINECDDTISVAYKVKKDDGYEVDGLYLVNEGESITLRNIRDQKFWAYAEKKSGGQWSGNTQVYLDEYDKSYDFFEKNMNLDSMSGQIIQRFACN